MKAIQPILILLLLGFLVKVFVHFRSRLAERFLVLANVTLAVVLILMPQWTTRIAHLLGVERGVDVVIYLSIVGLLYLCLVLYLRIRQLHDKLTDLARAYALAHAVPASSPEVHSTDWAATRSKAA